MKWSDWVMLVTALSLGYVMTHIRMKRRIEHSNSGLLQFFAAALCVKEESWREWERERGSVLGGQPFILSWGKVSKSSPWHSSGLKEAPAQKWPKTGTDRLSVARDSHSAEALLGPSAVLSSVLTSLPGLEKEAGGSLTSRRNPYRTVLYVHMSPKLYSVSYFCPSLAVSGMDFLFFLF